jgi:hypothetical membrane protein
VTDRLIRYGLWCGIAAPLVYLVTVVLGATSIPGYSHIADPISALTETGRTGTLWIELGFLLYNLLLAVFGATALILHRSSRLWAAAFALIILTTICGVLMGPFAQDPIGSPATVTGITHIVLAAITSLATIAILVLSAIGFRLARRRDLTAFAILCLLIVVPFGLAAAMAAANTSPVMGLFERTTIGGFEIWVFVVALVLARNGPFAPPAAAAVAA